MPAPSGALSLYLVFFDRIQPTSSNKPRERYPTLAIHSLINTR